MPLGAFRQSLNLANFVEAPPSGEDYGTYQGYFRASSSTVLNAYNTSDVSQASVTHGVGTLNYVRAKRIPGTTSHIVGLSGGTGTKFYRYTPGTGFVQLVSLVVAGRTNDITFDTTNNKIYMATTRSTTPFIQIYQADLSASVTSATTLSNPATLPAGVPQHIRFSNNGNFLAINHATTPFMRVYSRSGATFTSITPPTSSAAPTGIAASAGRFGISWNADDTTIAYVNSTTGFRLSNLSGSTFSSPVSVTTTTDIGCVAFNPNPLYKDVLLVSESTVQGRVYYWNGSSQISTTGLSDYLTETFQWSPDGLRTLFNRSANGFRTDTFNTSYTTSSNIENLLGTDNVFTLAARGFDWMFH